MGEIADMLLNGDMCEMCGVALEGDGWGSPRYCSKQCAHDRGMPFEDDDANRSQVDFLLSLASRLEKKGYDVEVKTPYHFRINGVVDVYPQNRKWHDLKTQKRGTYKDVLAFVGSFFRKIETTGVTLSKQS